MKKSKKIVIAVVLVGLALSCSGCFTALGAIIGYQSGEILAGALIGAGIDAGISIAEEAERQSEDLTIELDKGKIFAKVSSKGAEFIQYIEEAFDGEGWDYTLDYKKIRKNQDCDARWELEDKTEVSIKVKGDKFNLNVKSKDKDKIKEITGKIAELLKDKL